MRQIDDLKFLTTFYRRFCLRPTGGRENQNGLRKLHIEVTSHQLGLLVSICDQFGSLIDVGWDGDEAWPHRYTGIDGALGTCDRFELSKCIKSFLKKHGIKQEP